MTDEDRERDRAARELETELRFHEEETLAALRREGLSAENARREAEMRFGDRDRWRRRILRADVARAWSVRRLRERLSTWMTGVARDARGGLRALAGAPLFSVSAAAIFALVGAAATVAFALTGGVLLKPMPYPDSDRLVYIWGRDSNSRAGFTNLPISEPELDDWRGARHLQAAGGVVPQAMTLSGGGAPERVPAVAATGALFDALGVTPLYGRGLTPADGQLGARPVVVIGHEFWRRRFGGDPAIVGGTITLDDRVYDVVGVMPAGFAFPRVDEVSSNYGFEPGIDAYVAWRSGDAGPAVRGNRYLLVAARLAPGASLVAAEQEVNALTKAAMGGDTGGSSLKLVTFKAQAVSSVRASLLLLSGAMAVLIGIASLNLTHLLLVRVGDRQRQFAIRAALGASRAAIVRQIIVETLLLAIAGGGVGLVAAAGVLRLLRVLAPVDFPRLDVVAVDGGVIGASAMALLGCALVVGGGAALGLRRVAFERDLRTNSRGNAGATRSGPWLVAAEIALSVFLLLVGGLLARSFWRVTMQDPGFDAQHVLSFRLSLPPGRYPTGADVRRAYDTLVAELAARPPIVRAGYTWQLPMAGMKASTSYARDAGDGAMVLIHRVSPGYFQTMAMRIVRGSGLDGDTDLPPVVINEAAARVQWRDRDPLGQVVIVNGTRSRIVGVVSDVRHGSAEEPPAPELYQRAALRTMYVVVRGTLAPSALEATVRQTVGAFDPSLPLSDLRPLEARLEGTEATRRFTAAAMSTFAGLATVLALVGVYGVTSLVAARRRRELAIRAALGASPRAAVALLIRQHGLVLVAGLAAGTTAALGIARLFAPFLYETSPREPGVYAVVLLVTAVAGLLATGVPARRAGRVSPLEAMRVD